MINFWADHILADGGANSLEMWKGEIIDQVKINSSPTILENCNGIFLSLSGYRNEQFCV